MTAGHASLYYRRRGALGPVEPAADLLGHVARLRRSGCPRPGCWGCPSRAGWSVSWGRRWASWPSPGRSWCSATVIRRPTTCWCTRAGRPMRG
ncbi:hypothetical protein ACFQQB_61755 [Nonomuraea rubra]|uniref:hypothetical protein n=1 Tax=Nonomuraea rubra TaxID=46180 RepID=UPI00361A4194